MILGLFWDEMTSTVQSQVVRDLLAIGQDCEAVYWTGIELDACMRVLGVERCTDQDAVTVWRTYQTNEREVMAPTPVEVLPCVLHQETKTIQMRVNKNTKRKSEDQGYVNTFNPYDIPMPDPNTRTVDPRVNLIWT